MKKILLVLIVIVLGGTVLMLFRDGNSGETPGYRMVTIQQGDLEAVVSATGTLEPVTTVQVGTQVSGIIDEIWVDYNDTVIVGQVIASIDTTLLANAVAGAEAQLDRGEAELRQAQREYDRVSALHEGRAVADSDYNLAQYGLEVARASVRSAEVDLARARQNLRYATITAPIDGTVIARSVDVGQTVQASFSAPNLFHIAGDLTSMQILVAVDESDIGQIAEGQTARFTVQAYPDDTFEGTVRQVRLQSATEENVVNYTVVVDVGNPDGLLLPGMTATVDFLVETADDVFYVANAALRYRPAEAQIAAAFERLRAERDSGGDDEAGSRRPAAGAAAEEDRKMLWSLDPAGELTAIPVRTGISDGTYTAILGGDLTIDLEVIAGASSSSAVASAASSSPFQSQQSGNRRPPGPPGGGF